MVPLATTAPDDPWIISSKGQFRTRDGASCYSLMLADQHTRYLLACRGLRSTKGHQAQVVLKWAFRTYGLPRAVTNAGTFRFKDPQPSASSVTHPPG